MEPRETFGAAAAIEKRLHQIVAETATPVEYAALGLDALPFTSLFARAVAMLDEDLSNFAASDPASGGSCEIVFRAYSSYDVVVHYRLAHTILTLTRGSSELRKLVARKIADRGKVRSGVDVHPAAVIARRFVLDHAHGTVIGETCEIGNDCYVLGGVILGARGIAGNAHGKRHPTIGDRVQIGAFAKVLGPVRIGDGVFISPNSVITSDVPAGARVSIVNQMQMQHASVPGRCDFQVYGVGREGKVLIVLGSGLSSPSVDLVDDRFQQVRGVSIEVRKVDETLVRIRLDPGGLGVTEHGRLHLRVCDAGAEVVLLEPRALRELLEEHSGGPAMPRPGAERGRRRAASSRRLCAGDA